MRIIMIGGNKTVYFLARQFIAQDFHLTIINRDPVRSRELAAKTSATVVLGDGTHANRLEEAGARRADAVLALTSHDQDNLIACQIAQKLFGVPRVMALVNDPENEVIFEQLGINIAFSATRIIASLIQQQANFDEIITMIPIAKGLINVAEVRLDADSPAIGKSLQELELTEGSLVACIVRDNHVLVPRGQTRLLVGDDLVLISTPEHQVTDLQTLCGVDD